MRLLIPAGILCLLAALAVGILGIEFPELSEEQYLQVIYWPILLAILIPLLASSSR